MGGAHGGGWEGGRVSGEGAAKRAPAQPDALGGQGTESKGSATEHKGSEAKKQPCGNLHITANYANRQARSGAKAPCCLAERVGFEPTVTHNATPDFESGTFDHSDTSPA